MTILYLASLSTLFSLFLDVLCYGTRHIDFLSCRDHMRALDAPLPASCDALLLLPLCVHTACIAGIYSHHDEELLLSFSPIFFLCSSCFSHLLFDKHVFWAAISSFYQSFSFVAFLPVNSSHRLIVTSTYLGSNSIAYAHRPFRSHAIMVVPPPANRSRTLSPSRVLFLI